MIWLLGALVVAAHAALAATAPWTDSAGLFRALLACAAAGSALPLAMRSATASPGADPRTGRQLGWILVVATALHAVWLPVAPTLSDDVYRYAYEGALVRRGESPYAVPPARRAPDAPLEETRASIGHADLSSIYPPLSLAAFALGDAVGGVRGQKLVFASASLLTAAFLALWLRRRRLPPAWLALYAWSPLPALEYAGHAHHDALGLALLSAALWLAARRTATGSALAWAASVAAKGVAWVTLPAFWRTWPRRARWMAVAVAAAGLAPLLWLSRGDHAGWPAYATRWSHNGVAFGLLEPVLGDGLLVRGVLVACLVAGGLLLHRRTRTREGSALALTTLALFLSPTYHPWYGGWVLVWAAATGSLPAWLLAQGMLFTYALPGGAPTPGFAAVPLAARIVLWGLPLFLWWAMRRPRAGEADSTANGGSS